MENYDQKTWLKSRAVWGGIVAAVAGAAGLFGVTVTSEDQVTIVEAAVTISSLVGGLISIYGRIKASKKIK
jgi:hypothetical protein